MAMCIWMAYELTIYQQWALVVMSDLRLGRKDGGPGLYALRSEVKEGVPR